VNPPSFPVISHQGRTGRFYSASFHITLFVFISMLILTSVKNFLRHTACGAIHMGFNSHSRRYGCYFTRSTRSTAHTAWLL